MLPRPAAPRITKVLPEVLVSGAKPHTGCRLSLVSACRAGPTEDHVGIPVVALGPYSRRMVAAAAVVGTALTSTRLAGARRGWAFAEAAPAALNANRAAREG